MNTDDDFAEQLRARVAAAAPHIPVDTSVVISAAHRRRAFTRSAAVAGSLAVAFGGWAGANALPSFSQRAPSVYGQTANPTPTASSTSAGTPCGTVFALKESDSPDVEVQGMVQLGRVTSDGGFEGGMIDHIADTLFVDVSVGPDVPDGPLDGRDRSSVTTMLVGPDGTVAFRTDPEKMIRYESADGAIAPDGLYDAVDCRTGLPLTGTYRVYATTGADGSVGGETRELSPLSFGQGNEQFAGEWPDLVPRCGRPAPAELLAGDAKADFDVTIDPDADLADVHKGVHLDVTVTATDPGLLTGRVPQTLNALLVDRDGVVVSRLYDPTRQAFDSGATFDVSQGGSFPAEVYQWFATCPDRYGNVRAGTYDLYVYSVILASAGPDRSPAPRVALGGPFPITLR